jgi:hypothetical protein
MSERKPRIGILGIMQDLYDDMIPGIARASLRRAARSAGCAVSWARGWRVSRLLCTTTKRPGGQTLRPPPSVYCCRLQEDLIGEVVEPAHA